MILDIEKIKLKIKSLKTSVYSEPVQSDVLTPAAILIPIFEKDNQTHILFTKRTDKVSHHKGQISFPGGKFDLTDKDLEETALRETYEEIGVETKDINIIGKINNMITNTSFIITPYIGTIPYPYDIKVSENEIDELIYVPVSHLLDKAFFREEQKYFNGQNITIYYYDYLKYTIWGVTGKILFDFLTLIQDI